jgi:formiminotetrahydrofolate cyclodeaminase
VPLTTDDYLDLRLGQLLDRLSADGLAPGAGSAAALTVAFASRLVAMVARCSLAWEEAAGVRAQANAISERAVDLAHTDGRAWEDALTALRDAEAGGDADPRRSFSLEQKLEAAAAAPIEIASLGADVAALAALAGEHGDATYRADAAAAAALAAGGSAAAAHLVRVNLGVRTTDPRLARALASERAAHDVADRMLESNR